MRTVSISVAAMFLTVTNGDVSATNGVTLGGAAISGAGPWLGGWTTLSSFSNGQCLVAVPATSAAVVRIQAANPSGPPLIDKFAF